MRAASALATVALLTLTSAGCRYESWANPDKDAAPTIEVPPPPLIEPNAAQVDEDLRICLSGKSHPSHIGKERSRLMFRRIERWSEKYEAALPKVYGEMLRADQAPGSHADFCIQTVTRGDAEREEALLKRVGRVRGR